VATDARKWRFHASGRNAAGLAWPDCVLGGRTEAMGLWGDAKARPEGAFPEGEAAALIRQGDARGRAAGIASRSAGRALSPAGSGFVSAASRKAAGAAGRRLNASRTPSKKVGEYARKWPESGRNDSASRPKSARTARFCCLACRKCPRSVRIAAEGQSLVLGDRRKSAKLASICPVGRRICAAAQRNRGATRRVIRVHGKKRVVARAIGLRSDRFTCATLWVAALDGRCVAVDSARRPGNTRRMPRHTRADSRELSWTEIEDEYGRLVEIPLLPDGAWDIATIRAARHARLLWTRVEPGLVSTGLHYVNREAYLLAQRPHPEDVDISEVDPDLGECPRCADFHWNGAGMLCDECEASD
jgi:hypothetical protein